MTSRRQLLTAFFEGFKQRPLRLVRERCWAVMGQPCDYCVPVCPQGREALRFDGGVPVVGPACDGCGKCVEICTATPAALELSG